MYEKHFDAWIKVKEKIHNDSNKTPFNEKEVWWCCLGENVGVEISGKGEDFTRPVVIFKKLSADEFLGIPLSTQLHNGSWYATFIFNSIRQTAFLSQIRTMSTFRLKRRIGELSNSDYKVIKKKLFELYFK